MPVYKCPQCGKVHQDESQCAVAKQQELFRTVQLPHRPARFVPAGKTVEERLMSRKDDPQTSVDAARAVAPHLSELQELVLYVYRTRGPMTAGECERLGHFAACAPSTCRKRICEMVKAGHLVATGERRGGMQVWEAVP